MEVEATSVAVVTTVFLARSGEVDFSRFFFVDILFEQSQEKEAELAGKCCFSNVILWSAKNKIKAISQVASDMKDSDT